MAGRVPVQRYVDVAAEDEVPVSLFLSSSSVEPALPQVRPTSSVARPEGSSGHGTALRVAGWVTAGTLAAGGAVFGVLANQRSKDLERARAQYPVTPDVLNHDAAATTTLAVLADSFLAAAVVVGGDYAVFDPFFVIWNQGHRGSLFGPLRDNVLIRQRSAKWFPGMHRCAQ